MKKNILKTIAIWKVDIVLSLVVIIGFEMINSSLSKLQETPFYFEFLSTAKWLLIFGFAIHGLTNWLSKK